LVSEILKNRRWRGREGEASLLPRERWLLLSRRVGADDGTRRMPADIGVWKERVMKSRIAVIAAASAALAFGSFTFAQSATPGSAAGSETNQSSQTGAAQGGVYGQTGAAGQSGTAGQTGAEGQSSMQGGMMGGQQAEAQMRQQLRQIAQNPGQNAAEKLFVLNAAQGNLKEEQLGQMVQQKAQNQQVKDLAKQITQDHQQLQQQLQQAAQALGVQLPQSLPEAEQQKIQILASLPADQLDKQFTITAEADHARDITEYQAVAQTAQDQQVKQYAQQALPILQKHAQLADQSAQALGLPNPMEPIEAGFKMGASNSSGSSSTPGESTGSQSGNSGSNSSQSGQSGESGQSGQ
jgi:putative membrane protein